MPLFKYFEKRAKDSLPNSNGPLFSCVPLDKSVSQPGVFAGGSWRSAELAAPEGKKCGP